MKSRIALLCVGLVSAGFGMDEYLPVQQGKLEVDLGYGFIKPTGFFDDDGERQSWDDLGAPDDYSAMASAFLLQLKYGIAPGLDVELAWPAMVANDDAVDNPFIGYGSGFARPEIGLKYANAAMMGAGVYANLALPFATGDFDGPGLPTSLELGAVYQNRFGDLRLTGRAGYDIYFEADDLKLGNVFSVLAKPEAMWTEDIGTYLALALDLTAQDEVNGVEADNGGYLLTVGPGLNVQLLDNLAYEIAVPISVVGKNNEASWGIAAQIYYTLP